MAARRGIRAAKRRSSKGYPYLDGARQVGGGGSCCQSHARAAKGDRQASFDGDGLSAADYRQLAAPAAVLPASTPTKVHVRRGSFQAFVRLSEREVRPAVDVMAEWLADCANLIRQSDFAEAYGDPAPMFCDRANAGLRDVAPGKTPITLFNEDGSVWLVVDVKEHVAAAYRRWARRERTNADVFLSAGLVEMLTSLADGEEWRLA